MSGNLFVDKCPYHDSSLFVGFKLCISEWQNASPNGIFTSVRFIDSNLLVIITNFLCLNVLVLTCLGKNRATAVIAQQGNQQQGKIKC